VIPILARADWRTLLPGQISVIQAVDVETGAVRVLATSDTLVLEAPNWTPDGRWIVVNAGGLLYRIPASGGEPEQIATGWLADHNNDHLVSRDGTTIYTSSETSGHLYAVPLEGGEPRRVSGERPGPFGYFLQGESPDGRVLAYTGAERRDGRAFASGLFLLDLEAPRDPSTDARLHDWPEDSVGCEFDPSGAWLYFSSERDADVLGHAQLHRMRVDGSELARLTHDERVNWFPKLSPDGTRLLYLSFPPGTVGHEANVPVIIRSLDPKGGAPRDVAAFRGGQGTLNVNGWAPDSRWFACAAYPLEGENT
jgi:TolB protein